MKSNNYFEKRAIKEEAKRKKMLESLHCDNKNESIKNCKKDKDMIDDVFEEVVIVDEPCFKLFDESFARCCVGRFCDRCNKVEVDNITLCYCVVISKVCRCGIIFYYDTDVSRVGTRIFNDRIYRSCRACCPCLRFACVHFVFAHFCGKNK